MPRYPHIDDLECCSYCGSNHAFYVNIFVRGYISHRTGFNGQDIDNGQLYDGLTWGEQSDYFCDACDRKIATVKSSPKKEKNNVVSTRND